MSKSAPTSRPINAGTLLRDNWPLLPAVGLFALLAYHLRFIQDDAYISYRYVANFLNGYGLVYNIGERVEGFTNFGWVIWMTLWGQLGDIYIAVSRWTGFLFGIGIIVLSRHLALVVLGERDKLLTWLAPMLVAANMSLAYWSGAGLETAAFAFFALLAVVLYLRRSWLLIWCLVMAVWLRPEGAFVAGLLIVVEAIVERRIPRFSVACALAAFLLSLPFVGFKLAYFGSVLPNPFYAKTGLQWEQVGSGLEYAGRFLGHYAFYGVGLLACLLTYPKLTRAARTVLLFVLVYVAYIVLVGGDVLKVHRFFLPLVGMVAVLNALALATLVASLSRKNRILLVGLVGLGLLVLTLTLPRGFVERYHYYEKAFAQRMQWLAQQMKASDKTDFSAAIPTIGIFGYELLGHDIIDMLGLTDSTIARHSEEPIPGMETTWKELSHNSRYILDRGPDYISFSTGIKPSAPAERALCLFPQFLQSYRTRGWYYDGGDPSRKGTLSPVFRRERQLNGPFEPTYPVAYVEEYKTGLDAYVAGDFPRAIRHYNRAIAVSPQPYNPYLIQQKALALMLNRQHELAMPLLDSLVATDSLIFEAHKDLYLYAILLQDAPKAAIHQRWLQRLVPWYWPRIQGEAQRNLRLAQEAMQQRLQGQPGQSNGP